MLWAIWRILFWCAFWKVLFEMGSKQEGKGI